MDRHHYIIHRLIIAFIGIALFFFTGAIVTSNAATCLYQDSCQGGSKCSATYECDENLNPLPLGTTIPSCCNLPTPPPPTPTPLACNNTCSSGASQCSGTNLQTCQLQPSGCYDWVTTGSCGGSTPVPTPIAQDLIEGFIYLDLNNNHTPDGWPPNLFPMSPPEGSEPLYHAPITVCALGGTCMTTTQGKYAVTAIPVGGAHIIYIPDVPAGYQVTAPSPFPTLQTGGGLVHIGLGQQAQPTVDIKANNSDGPITVPWNSTVQLSWTSTNATSCAASQAWGGSKNLNGSETTQPLTIHEYHYTLTCTGPTGSAADTVTVYVNTTSFIGWIFYDTNQNGVYDQDTERPFRPEFGYPPVTITFTGGPHNINQSRSWDIGKYSSGELEPGTYTMTTTAPPGYQVTTTNPLTATGCGCNIGLVAAATPVPLLPLKLDGYFYAKQGFKLYR